MATAKAHLKAAREAISSKNWQQALSSAQAALEIDHQSYNANVFLGVAHLNLEHGTESGKSYRAAISIDPNQPLAWQGLISLHEKLGNTNELIDSIEHLMKIWFAKGEAEKLGEMILKLISLPNKSRQQSIAALSLVLSDSPFHSILSILPEPDYTNPKASPIFNLQEILSNTLPVLNEIIQLTQDELEQTLSNEISKRRTRLTTVSKTAAQTKAEVIAEIYPSSSLPKLWQEILNHPMADDQTRRQIESKLISFYLDWLQSLPSPFNHRIPTPKDKKSDRNLSNIETFTTDGLKLQAEKDIVRTKIEELARGQAILKTPNQMAWDIVLDWGQVLPDNEASDSNGFLKFLPDAMPNAPLSNLILAFQQLHGQTGVDQDSAFEDPLEQIELSFEDAQNHSILSHLIAASIYHDLKEWGTVIKIAEEGMNKISEVENLIGKRLLQAKRLLTIHLACALTFEKPPVHHLRAIRYLDVILADEPDNGPVLLAKASVLWHRRQWEPAEKLYLRSLEASRDLTNQEKLEIQSEKAWCTFNIGKINLAIQNFETIIQGIEELVSEDPQSQELNHHLAQSWYRLGRCNWALSHPSEDSNSNEEINSDLVKEIEKTAYTCFIKSIKCDTSIASAFTYLGLYYAEQNEHARSSKCFQRAFELDPTEDIAAFRLASEFAHNMQWDLVSVVTKRLILGTSFQTHDLDAQVDDEDEDHPALTSLASYQHHTWAWKAAGVVELTQNKFDAAINTFQRASRYSPDDYQIWLKLGLAYQGAGKHIAALKSFLTARRLIDNPVKGTVVSSIDLKESIVWYIDFCIGNTQRQIGLLEPAIQIVSKIVENRPQESSIKIVLAETKFAMGLKQSEKGAFDQAERYQISCLDIVRDVFETSEAKFATKSGWKIAGNVFSEFARWNFKIPLTTFNVKAEDTGNLNEVLRTHLSYFVNLAAKMNIDNILPKVQSVSCLEVSAILSENGSAGVFHLISALAFKVRLILEISTHQSDLTAQAWADLAISLGNLSRWLESSSSKSSSNDPSECFKTQTVPQGILSEAIYCVKAGLQLNSFSSENWNILGVLTFNLNPRLSQHAFIRSVELGGKNYPAWCNLGFFYLAHSDLELATEAFEKCKTIEPDWSLAWMGLALIASLDGQQLKAGELVEHAYDLSLGSISTIESCCATVALKTFTSQAQHSSQHVNNLIGPMLAAEKLLKRYPMDPTVLNLHALISECLGNLDVATESLERSAEILETIYEVTESVEVEQRYMLANLNLGRIKLRRKKYEEAIQALEIIPALKPKFSKNSEPIDKVLQTTIIRTQAASQIAISQFYLQDLQGCLSGLEESLDEIKLVQKDESVGTSQCLRLHSSTISKLRAQVLWSSQSNQSKAKQAIIEAVSENLNQKVYDFDLISCFLAMLLLEVPDEELVIALKACGPFGSKDEIDRNQIEATPEADLTKQPMGIQNVKTKKPETLLRLENLVMGKDDKLTRNYKSETNTILNFIQSSIELNANSKRYQFDTLSNVFETIKKVIGKFILEIKETESEKKMFQQQILISKSLQLSSTDSHNDVDKTKINPSDHKISDLNKAYKNLCLPDQLLAS